MVNSTFHVDTFRQWNPPRTKSLPSHKHLNHLRYPTPPISVANSPSLPKPPHDSPSKLLIPLPINNRQHLLPARPPAEVCVHPNVRSRTPSGSSHRTRENSVSVSCTSHADNFGYVTTPPQAQLHHCSLNLSPHSSVDFQSATDGLIESLSVQDTAADSPSSHSLSSLEEFFRLSDEQSAIPIDPAILGNEDSLEASELHQAVHQSCCISPSDQELAYPYPEPPLMLQITPDHHSSSSEGSVDEDSMTHVVDRPHTLDSGTNLIRSDGQGQNSHGHEQSKTCKRHSNRTKGAASEERPPKRLRTAAKVYERGQNSFSALRSHFLSLPFDERLQFLSWLFEGALPRCTSDLESATSLVPMTCGPGNRDVPSPRRRTQPHAAPTTSNEDETNGRQMSSRKGMPWSPEEDDLLIKLRRDQRLPWSEVTRLFSEQYSGRSQGSIQVYWSTTLKAKLKNRAE